jgi:hypothetical protein
MSSSDGADASTPQALLISHSILVGLTPFIPVPFLDGFVKLTIERRLVASLALHRSALLHPDAVRELAGERRSALAGIVRSIVKYPFRTMLRKVFIALQVKRASDEASLAYHRAFLVDRALARKLIAPSGQHSSAEVRDAIDKACEVVPVSPLRHALAGAFEASRAGLGLLGRRMMGPFAKQGGAIDDADLGSAVAAAESSDVLRRAREAVEAVPREHFAALERAFDEALMGRNRKAPSA